MVKSRDDGSTGTVVRLRHAEAEASSPGHDAEMLNAGRVTNRKNNLMTMTVIWRKEW